MRTVRCSGRRGGGGVYPSMHWAGVCIPVCTGWGGVYPSMHWAGGVCQGVCVPRGVVCAGGGMSAQEGCVYPSMHWAGGCLSQCMLGYTPSHEQNSWHTLVKKLPFCNYVADGKNGNESNINNSDGNLHRKVQFRVRFYLVWTG